MKKCFQCPHGCGKKNFCQAPEKIKINTFQLHFGEEPCISGYKGSGAIFFAHCNLQCVFCQNYPISQEGKGQICSDNEFLKIFEQLKNQDAHNLNLVSPTCYISKLIPLLKRLKKFNPVKFASLASLKLWRSGQLFNRVNFTLPIIWNSNAYESVKMIKKLNGLIDIYLPDFKYSDNKLAVKYSQAPNYFEFAQKAILEMFKQQPKNKFENKIMKKGIIVRHLVLPHCLENSKNVLKWLRENLSKNVLISLMSQYTPMYRARLFPEINQILLRKEYDEICNYALDLGFENIYTQELASATDAMVPEWR